MSYLLKVTLLFSACFSVVALILGYESIVGGPPRGASESDSRVCLLLVLLPLLSFSDQAQRASLPLDNKMQRPKEGVTKVPYGLAR